MKIKTKFPRRVEVREHEQWIPLSSGYRLAARIWLPEDAESDPVPALLEYLPYRKRDMTRPGDEPKHHYYAGHGYASVRVDLRGAGDSFGVMDDEYTLQEHDDCLEVIDWLSNQPWCTGAVGMFGISWGGFNALQVAARRPPALKAIITSCSTDDRYTDDMHYSGGCVLNDGMDWGTTFFGILPLPGDPAIMGEGWRENWLERLADIRCPVERWMNHQHRDDYWKHGSVNEDYDAIECAVFAVGGWLDGYSNAIPRLLANLSCPRLGLISAHGHQWGHSERPPAPTIGFLQEALRWWDHWLKDEQNGVMQEPMLRAYMGEDIPAQPFYESCPGRWVGESSWPSSRITPKRLYLANGLVDEVDERFPITHRSMLTVGLAAGEWCPYGTGGDGPEFPSDQRFDDGASLTFDGQPLAERLEILGAPVVRLVLSVDAPRALVAVRLNDVKPDGSVARVSYAVLNLCHRDGHESPSLLEPGQRYQVDVKLNDCAYAFRPGHRLRVSVSTSYWPMVWPSPTDVTLTLHAGESVLELPVRPLTDGPAVTAFEPPEEGPPMSVTQLEHAPGKNMVTRDVGSGRIEVVSERGGGMYRIDEHGLCFGRDTVERMALTEGDPLSAETEMVVVSRMQRDDWTVRVEARTRLTCDAEQFFLEADLDVAENGEQVKVQSWSIPIPRDCV
ncbi:MAG: peptidase S15 [Thiotrichales bacterium]|nr:peptidase S15 [Thiotrichales bacterium]